MMVASSLSISFFDLLNLMPSKVMAKIFIEFKKEESAFVSLMLSSASGFGVPNIVFEDIHIDLDDGNDSVKEYVLAHTEGNTADFSRLNSNFEEATPQQRIGIFFNKYVLPLVLHQLIDFKGDTSKQLNEIILGEEPSSYSRGGNMNSTEGMGS